MLVLTVVLTAVVALALGLAPAKVARRRVRQCDLGWAAGLWLATWVFALCAYHRPGLTVGFDAFRLAAITALCGWASFCVAGLRSFGGRGLRFVVPLLLAAALALTVMLAGCSSQEEAEPLPQGMDTETVLTAGEAVLDQLLEGDYEAVYESFREDIRADLTAQSVQDLVEPVFQEAGDYQELKSAQVTGSTEGEEHGIAQLLCIFSQEKVSIRVAFDPDMELIGLSAGLQKSSWSLSNLVNNFTGLFRGD